MLLHLLLADEVRKGNSMTTIIKNFTTASEAQVLKMLSEYARYPRNTELHTRDGFKIYRLGDEIIVRADTEERRYCQGCGIEIDDGQQMCKECARRYGNERD